MAEKAMFGQDRANISIEIDLRLGMPQTGQKMEQGQPGLEGLALVSSHSIERFNWYQWTHR